MVSFVMKCLSIYIMPHHLLSYMVLNVDPHVRTHTQYTQASTYSTINALATSLLQWYMVRLTRLEYHQNCSTLPLRKIWFAMMSDFCMYSMFLFILVLPFLVSVHHGKLAWVNNPREQIGQKQMFECWWSSAGRKNVNKHHLLTVWGFSIFEDWNATASNV